MRAALTISGIGLALSFVLIGAAIGGPINPMVYKTKFDEAKKTAELVAEVRVLSAVCTEVSGEGKVKMVTLQLALQVLESEKGTAKKNDILVVSRQVPLPAGPGPGMYGYWAAANQFPFTPGVKGSVALRWDTEAKKYVAIAGWVPKRNDAEIPKEVGAAKVMVEASK